MDIATRSNRLHVNSAVRYKTENRNVYEKKEKKKKRKKKREKKRKKMRKKMRKEEGESSHRFEQVTFSTPSPPHTHAPQPHTQRPTPHTPPHFLLPPQVGGLGDQCFG